MTEAPRSASIARTVLLPQAMLPVTPRTKGRFTMDRPSGAQYVGGEDLGEDGAREVGGDAVHVDIVPEATAHLVALAAPAKLAESRLFVGAAAGQVVFEDGEHD